LFFLRSVFPLFRLGFCFVSYCHRTRTRNKITYISLRHRRDGSTRIVSHSRLRLLLHSLEPNNFDGKVGSAFEKIKKNKKPWQRLKHEVAPSWQRKTHPEVELLSCRSRLRSASVKSVTPPS
jgi:hypothetical protein